MSLLSESTDPAAGYGGRHATQFQLGSESEGVELLLSAVIRTYGFSGVLRGLRNLGSQPPLRTGHVEAVSSPGLVYVRPSIVEADGPR